MKYIIDFNIKSKNDNILDLVINKARNLILSQFNIDIKENGLTNKCDYVRKIVADLLDKENIYYDFMETNKILGNDVVGHSFLVAYIEDKRYIVDSTYLQFFDINNCKKDNYKEVNGLTIKAPLPGYYYIDNPKDINIALELLEYGYIELTKKNAKVYLDSFYLTRRGRRIDIDISQDTYLNVFDNERRKNNRKK